MKKAGSSPGRFLIGALVLIFAVAFARPALLEGRDTGLYVLAAVVSGVILVFGSKPLSRILFQDHILLVISLAFCGMSILAAAQVDIGAARAQAFRCAGALVLMIAGSLFIRVIRPSGMLALVPGVPALVLLVIPFMTDTGSHMNSVSLVLLMLSFVIMLSSRKQLPAMLFALAGTALFLAREDLISAAVWSITFLLLFWSYSGHPVILIAGSGIVVLSGYFANLLNPGMFLPAGTASLFTEMNPGWVGLEMSDPFLAESVSSEASMFQWIVFRFGWIFAACVLLLYPVIMMRASALARASGNRLHGLAAMGAVLLTGLTAIAALLSDFGIWPIPGLSLPGITDSMPSLCTFSFLMGLCGGVSVRNRTDLEEDAHIAMLAE